jgi:hypothetical protein
MAASRSQATLYAKMESTHVPNSSATQSGSALKATGRRLGCKCSYDTTLHASMPRAVSTHMSRYVIKPAA